MDFKIQIKCMKCRCSHELRPGDFKIRDYFECPNCGQVFPSDVYDKLKTGVVALGEVPAWIPEKDDTSFQIEPKEFSLKVIEYDEISDVMHKGN